MTKTLREETIELLEELRDSSMQYYANTAKRLLWRIESETVRCSHVNSTSNDGFLDCEKCNPLGE